MVDKIQGKNVFGSRGKILAFKRSPSEMTDTFLLIPLLLLKCSCSPESNFQSQLSRGISFEQTAGRKK